LVKSSVLLVEPDSTTADFIRHMLTRSGYPVQVVKTGKDGLIAAWRDQPDIIIIELELPDLEGLQFVSRLRKDNRTQRTKIICLTSRSAPEDTVQAMEAGVDTYLVKQKDAMDILLQELGRIVSEIKLEDDAPAPIQSGQMVSFLGAQGGAGTSSICLNAANFMAALDAKHSVAAFDLVLPIGSLARISGAKRGVNLANLTKLPPATLSPDYIRTNLPRPQAWNCCLLPGSENPLEARTLLEDRLSALLQTMRATFTFIFVDVGQNLSRLALLALSQSVRLVMVLTPDEQGVTQTLAVMAFLQHEHIPLENMRFITNRPIATEGWTKDKVEQELGQKVSMSIPHMGESCHLANSLRAPLSLRFPNEMGTLSLQQFTSNLANDLAR